MREICLFNSCRDQDVLTTKQSLRIISNLAAAGATGGIVNEILSELLNFTAKVVSLKSSELSDLLAKVVGLHLFMPLY